jgi:hypothetical protein
VPHMAVKISKTSCRVESSNRTLGPSHWAAAGSHKRDKGGRWEVTNARVLISDWSTRAIESTHRHRQPNSRHLRRTSMRQASTAPVEGKHHDAFAARASNLSSSASYLLVPSWMFFISIRSFTHPPTSQSGGCYEVEEGSQAAPGRGQASHQSIVEARSR